MDKTIFTHAFLDSKNVSMYRLARDFNIPDSTIANVIKGRSAPRLGLARRIASYFDMSLDELYFLSEIDTSLPYEPANTAKSE